MRNSKIVNIRALAIIIVVLGHSIILYSKSWGFFESIYDVPIFGLPQIIYQYYSNAIIFFAFGLFILLFHK